MEKEGSLQTTTQKKKNENHINTATTVRLIIHNELQTSTASFTNISEPLLITIQIITAGGFHFSWMMKAICKHVKSKIEYRRNLHLARK